MVYGMSPANKSFALAWAMRCGGTFSTKDAPVSAKTASYMASKGYFEKLAPGKYRLTEQGLKAVPKNWELHWKIQE